MRFKSNIKIVVSAVLVICILISLVTFTAMADSAPRLISLTLDGRFNNRLSLKLWHKEKADRSDTHQNLPTLSALLPFQQFIT